MDTPVMSQPVRTAPRFFRVPGAADLADGELRGVQVGVRKYVLARVGDERFACENRCLHYGIKLSQGHLGGSTIECRWHHWRFDLRSGTIETPVEAESDFESFNTYDVQVDGADLLISEEPRTRLRRKAVPPQARANDEEASCGCHG